MQLIKKRKVFFLASAIVILIGIAFMIIQGFNLGIDFTGGTMLTLQSQKMISAKDISSSLEEFNLSEVVQHSGENDSDIIIRTKVSIDAKQREQIREKLIADHNLKADTQMSIEQFGPNIGSEISQKAVTSVLLAALGMLVYIWFRFKLLYGISSVLSLLHNILIVLGLYSIFSFQLNSNFIAAMLTIVGYSINDTIVIFDRIRDNEKTHSRRNLETAVGKSIDQSLARTFFTSLTTFVVIFMLYIMGVPTMKEFAIPIMAGIIVGTYSSVCIAGAIWLELNLRFGK